MEELHSIGKAIQQGSRDQNDAGPQGQNPRRHLQFQAALAIDFENSRRKEQRKEDARERLAVELGDDTSEAEAVSYRLFDDGSLNYTDRVCAGTYDIWGDFVAAEEGSQAATFPSLSELESVPFTEGDEREVIVIDHRSDARLQEIEREAAAALSGCVQDGALACVQALARVVSEHLGGPSSHAELSEKYRGAVKEVKRVRQSLVIPIGELRVGVSRHRSLLLKALLDECSFACRILRGSFYLGAAGASGEAAIALVQIHEQEYMVELVTEPGRTTPLHRESVPLPTSSAVWGTPVNSKLSPTGGASIPVEEVPQVATDAPCEAGQHVPGQSQQIGDSITGPSTAAHSGESERTPSKAAGSASDTESSESQAGLKWGEGEELTQTALDSLEEGDSEGSFPDGGNSADLSVQSLAAARDSTEGPQLLQFPNTQEPALPGPGQRVSKSEESARSAPADPPVTTRQASVPLPEALAIPESAVKRRLSLLESFGGGTAPRARVRGKDASGQVVELELEVEGLTVTHQGQAGRRSLESLLPRPPPFQNDTRQLRSLESLVNRHQFWGSDGSPGDKQPAPSSTSSAEDNRWHIASLALDPQPGAPSASQGSSGETIRSNTCSSVDNVRSDPRSPGDDMQVDNHSSLYSQESTGARDADQAMPEQLARAVPVRSDRSVSPTTAQQTAHSLLSNPGHFTARGDGTASQRGGPGSRGPASTASNSRSGSSTQKSDVSWDGSNESSALSTAEHMAAAGLNNMAMNRAREEALGLPQGATRSHSAGATFYDAKGLASSMQDLRFRQRQQHSDHSSEDDRSAWGYTNSSAEDNMRTIDAPEVDDAEIDFDSLELGPRIGMGCFGEVFKAHWRQTTVAVKKFLEQSLSDQTLREFKAEVQMNRRLRHPNIIAFLGACTVRPNLCIVTAWAPRGSLYHLLHNSGPVNLTLRQKLRMALDTARGMHYLHSAKPPIIHRDLKSMNLLVDNDLTIKVCDFGLARVRSGTWMTGKSHGGTPEWTAPEVLRSQSWNEKSDVYSYGVILFELVSGEKPWADMSPMQVVGAVGWGHARLEVPPNCPPFFAGLMTRCWGEHTQRPSFEEIIRELIQHANKDRPKSSKPEEPAASTTATTEWASSSVPGLSDKASSSTPGESGKPGSS